MRELPEPPINIKDILDILPHRYPLLLVDRVVSYDVKGSIEAVKNVSINEPFFAGHFPGTPIMPGVLILEAMAQAGAVFVHLRDLKKRIGVLLNINQAKFRRPVYPGDVLRLIGKEIHSSSKGGRMACKALVGERVVAEAEIGFALVEKEKI